jgi:hypothetical protein
MNFPFFVFPYHLPPLWYTPLSRLTHTLPLDWAAAISGSLAFVAVLGFVFVGVPVDVLFDAVEGFGLAGAAAAAGAVVDAPDALSADEAGALSDAAESFLECFLPVAWSELSREAF